MLLKQKKKGLSTMIGAIFMVFLLFVLFFFSYYMKAIETLNINMKDDADMATMAAVTVDLDKYGKDHKDLYCIGSTDFNNPNGERNNHKANTTEQNEVYNLHGSYRTERLVLIILTDELSDEKVSTSFQPEILMLMVS